MRKIINIIGLICAIAATILSTTRFYKYAIIPVIVAALLWAILLLISQRSGESNKYLQYIGLLLIIASGLALFNSMTFDQSKTGSPKGPEVPVAIDSSSTTTT